MPYRLPTLLSLTLFLSTTLFWLTGYNWNPAPVWHESHPLTQPRYALGLGAGSLHLDLLTPSSPTPPQETQVTLGLGYTRCPAYALSPTGGPNILLGDSCSILLPFWLIILATSLLPLYRLTTLLRAKLTLPPGHCPTCRYDLRATPHQCPECGFIPDSSSPPR